MVVLPHPLGPRMPIRSPRRIVPVKPWTIGTSPYANPRSRQRITTRPDFSASWSCAFTRPISSRRARRSERSDSSAFTRPSLRVRRALIAAPEPGLLLRQLLVEERVLLGLDPQFFLPPLEIGVIAGPIASERAAVQVEDAGGEGAQKASGRG